MNPNYDWCGQPGCGAPVERWSSTWQHRDRTLDGDHAAIPQPPVGPVEEGLSMRATRYAEALAHAAAADARIEALTDLLAAHEFYRSQAEQALSSVEEDPQFGTVWQPTGPEPEDVSALLCLVTGEVYRRAEYGAGWQKAEHNPSTATRYEWPIENAGPFIAWRDSYGFDRVLQQARKDQTATDALHRRLYHETGYRSEDGVWGRPVLAEAIDRVLRRRDQRWLEVLTRAQLAEERLAYLRTRLSWLPETIDHEQIDALLAQRAAGGEG